MLELHIIQFGGIEEIYPVRGRWEASKLLVKMVEANQVTIRQAFLTQCGRVTKHMQVS